VPEGNGELARAAPSSSLVVDAVVIGSGVNGLVAAAQLAKGGWSVALIEGSDRLGGFIATEERTLPGYLHDTYSSWHPLFVSGGAYAALGEDLHRHGLEYRNTDGLITGTVTDEGRVVLAHRDPAATAESSATPRTEPPTSPCCGGSSTTPTHWAASWAVSHARPGCSGMW